MSGQDVWWGGSRGWLCLALLVAITLGAVGTALGQTAAPSPGDPQAAYEAAFQETLRQPSNLDVLFKFAVLASQVGDLEGAISALERMLVINPDIPRVRLELGVLYFRLGSYEAARTYLETALQSPSVPPEIRGRAERFLAEVNQRLKPSQLSGQVFLGWRYQSDANLAPLSPNVVLFGAPASLNQGSTGQADWGIVSSFQVNHRYDFEHQDKAALETQLVGYANRQFQLGTTDITYFDLATGPRFQVLSGTFEDVTLRPFLRGGDVLIHDTPYYASYGGGLEIGALLANRLRNTSTLRWGRQNHPDTSFLPTNSQYSGQELTFATSFDYQLSTMLALFAAGSATRFQADLSGTQSYQLWTAGGGMSVRFPDPAFKSTQLWNVAVAFSEQWWTYDLADPVVDPVNQRQQLDTIVSIVLSVPFDARTTFTVTGGRFLRSSNLPNYAFENDTAMFGVNWRF